jgi:serine/threonine protein kinase
VTVSKPAIQTFGKYQILERIATGGMAEIYKAKLEGIGGFQRTFAIKRILPNLSQNGEYIAMLVDEAKVAGLLSHANIVQILDLGQVDGIWYIAMEYVHGRDLGAVLRRAKKKGLCLPVPHTVFIAIELLKGLEYAHQRQVMRGGRPVALNIIHRDVSPPNVLLSFQGEVKLTDFGIARASLKAMETVSGIVKGRFDYMSPEQAAGAKDLDQRSDLFSVGVVLYEMLTGHHPFRTDNEIGTIERVRTGHYLPVSQRNPEVPFTLETIVDRALQVNRDDRYPSGTAFKEALDKFFHDAGFIFTHATLASYVRGLFPEATRAGGQAAATPPTGVTNSGLSTGNTGKQNRPAADTEGPTRRHDRKRLQDSGGLPATASNTHGSNTNGSNTGTTSSQGGSVAPEADTSVTAGRGGGHSAGTISGAPTKPSVVPVSARSDSAKPPAPEPGALAGRPLSAPLDKDEHETILRRPPAGGWDDEPATQLRSQYDEGHTLIRKSTTDLDEAMRERSSSGSLGVVGGSGQTGSGQTGSGQTGSGQTGSGTASGRARTASASETSRSLTGATRRKQGPGRGGWLGWLVSVVALVIGLAGGALITAIAAGLFAWTQGPTEAPASGTPMIEVLAPMGTQIVLNGDAVGKSVAVEPGVVQNLVVTVRGGEPWSTEVKLGPGETRVFVFTAVEPKPKESN